MKRALMLGLALGLVGVVVGFWSTLDNREYLGEQWRVSLFVSSAVCGVPGLVIGSVLGILVPSISIGARFLIRHAAAFMGSLAVWVLVLVLLDVLFGMTPYSEEPWEPATCCVCWTEFWVAFVLFPISVVAESLLVRRLKWRWWAHVLTMAIVFFVASGLPLMVSFMALGLYSPDFEDMEQATSVLDFALPGLVFSFWGTVYWSILRAVDTLLNAALGKKREVASKWGDFS